MKRGLLFNLVLVGLMGLALTLAGCSGDDGATGPQGPQGIQGEPGPVTQTNESCGVCHSAGAVAAVADVHTENATVLNNGTLVPTITAVTDDGAGNLTVAFSVVDGNGDPVTGLTMADILIGDLVPAGTVAGWNSIYAEEWYWPTHGMMPLPALTEVDAVNNPGDYTLGVGTNLADAATSAPEFSTAHTQRVVIRVGGNATIGGDAGYNPATAIQDFDLTGGAATLVSPVGVKAPTDGCKNCHGDQMLGMPVQAYGGHPSWFQDTRACAICHSPLGSYGTTMQDDSAYLARFIHGIHAAKSSADIPGFAEFEEGGGHAQFPDANGVHQGFAVVTYPKEIKDCAVCHTGNGNMTDGWESNPSGAICTSCHTGNVINADGSMSHDTTNYPTAPAGSYTDAVCSGCHPSSAIASAHAVTTLKNAPDVSITPVYTTTITLTGASGAGGEFLAGDTPVVTVSASDASGAMATADLTAARLYVYGPRSKALPILTPGSTTDPAWDPTTAPNQATDLLSTTDANVTIEATDIKYQLQAIPDTLENGTYMVMAYLTYPSSRSIPTSFGSYNIDGWQLINFQVGTTTVQPRVAGDGCNKCHDLTDWTSTAHRAYFGTDGCLACHDQSGGHADTIANRVHAVHGATAAGDLSNRDWTDITFPQSNVAEGEPTTTYCLGCHNSTSATYRAPDDANQPSQWAKPCIGCHGDMPGAKDHMIQNGGPL